MMFQAIFLSCCLLIGVSSAESWAQEPRYDGRSLSEWQDALAGPDPKQRYHAVQALWQLRAVPQLIRALGDTQPEGSSPAADQAPAPRWNEVAISRRAE